MTIDWVKTCNLTVLPEREGQADVLKSLHFHPFTLMSGSSGSGKSLVLVAAMAYLNMLFGACNKTPPITALASTNRDKLKGRVVPHIQELLVRKGFGEVRGATKTDPAAFHFFDKRFGVIRLVSLTETQDLRGLGLWAIGIDEVSLLPYEDWIDVLRAVRFSGTLNPLQHQQTPILAATNVDGPFADWCEDLFVKKSLEEAKANPDNYHDIPLWVRDVPNKVYAEGYTKTLEAMPFSQREALLYGKWGSNVGRRFKTAPQEIATMPPKRWKSTIGLDWGLRDDCYAVWVAWDEEGHPHPYHELCFNDVVVTDAAPILLDEIEKVGYKIKRIYADESMFRRESTGESIASHFEKVGLKLEPAPNEPKIANLTIERYIEEETLFVIRGECPVLLDALANARWGENPKPEQLVPHKYTHPIVSLAYSLQNPERSPSLDTDTIEEAWQKSRNEQILKSVRARMVPSKGKLKTPGSGKIRS